MVLRGEIEHMLLEEKMGNFEGQREQSRLKQGPATHPPLSTLVSETRSLAELDTP